MRKRGFEIFAALMLICIIGFMGINILYFIGKWYPYQKCSSELGSVSADNDGIIERGIDYDYKIEMPDYLKFESGSLKIKPKNDPIMTINENGFMYSDGEPYIEIIIKPQVFGPAKVMVSVLAEDGLWQMPINDRFEYVPDRKEPKEITDHCKELLKEHESEIRVMLDAAENKWPNVFE